MARLYLASKARRDRAWNAELAIGRGRAEKPQDEVSIAELDLLNETTDTLIEHMAQLKEAQVRVGD